MRELLLAAAGLTKRFGQGFSSVVAVRDASFEVREGDRVALVGPSGSGKSTLLHLMAALDRPTEGTIEWPGLGAADELRPGLVSMSFQGPSLLPPLSVEENVALPLLLVGASDQDALREARNVLERLDLTAVAQKLPEEISGGQAQRAALARAMVGHPRLILADEPTGQQDRATGQRTLDVLLNRGDEIDAAVVVATHDIAVAERFPIRWSMEDRRLDTGAALRSA